MNHRYNSQAIKIREQRVCFYCGKLIKNKKDLTLDHILPVIQGGTNSPDNLVCCCSRCNEIKGYNTIYETVLQLEKDLKWASGKRKEVICKDLENFKSAQIKWKTLNFNK